MTDKEKQFNEWFDEYADGVKVFEEADMKQAYLQGRADLEQENTELKTKKIPQLERRIASVRGSHSVDTKKLNARIEQVERLKKENAELKETVTKMNNVITETFRNLSKAKVVLRNVIDYLGQFCSDYPDCVIEAELFLKDSEVEK